MLNPFRLMAFSGLLMLSVCTASVASAAYADPPERVAHLSHIQGEMSYSPAGEDEWFGVVRNRPLIRGDRLWTDRDARAEFQVGSTAVRLGSDTSVEILDLNDDIAQIKMTQGTLNLRVRRMYPGQILEIATPTLAFTIDRAGRYRIDVDRRNAITTIVVWEGAGEAYGENSSFRLQAGDTVRFYDTDLRDYEMYGLPREDDFDRYCLDRDRRLDRSASLRYLDDDVVGYADLDEYGNWRPDSRYGNVWYPSRVDADWAPYRDGHWVWQEPWGWTWVDNAPWGFAPSHYGRWVYITHRWGWIPGPRNVRPVYAPALVAFVGGSGWSVSISFGGGSPIGWFPLGPREVYVPSYQASRDYFKRVNVNNTVINNTTITNVYNNYSSGTINVGQVNYANRTVAGAVTAVPSTVFVNAQPVRPAAIRLDRKAVTTGTITRVAPIAPSVRSVTGASTATGARPSREAIDRRVFVRNAPPPVERPFAVREQQLQKTPGRAPAPEAVKPVPGRDDSTAQKVRVIGEQRGAVDARAAGSRRASGKPDAPAAAPGQLKPLDRSVEPVKEPEPVPGDRSRDKEQKTQSDVQQKQQAAEKQQAERSRQSEMQKQADEKQQAERKRQTEIQQQQAAEKQQAERKRQSELQKQADEKQQAERKRQTEMQQQQAAEKQQVERKRQTEMQKQADEKQQAERKRQTDVQQQQAAEKQQIERKRQNEMQKQADEKQQAERKRQTDVQQQQAAEKQQIERKRQSELQKQADEKQQAERKRQTDVQQQQAAEKQQIERKRQSEMQKQADEKQQVERKRQTEIQKQRQAECEREAIRLNQDPSKCRIETLPQENRENPNRDKNGK
ncbi:DUF6600 domain-containing protein [Thiobacillus sp.]